MIFVFTIKSSEVNDFVRSSCFMALMTMLSCDDDKNGFEAEAVIKEVNWIIKPFNRKAKAKLLPN